MLIGGMAVGSGARQAWDALAGTPASAFSSSSRSVGLLSAAIGRSSSGVNGASSFTPSGTSCWCSAALEERMRPWRSSVKIGRSICAESIIAATQRPERAGSEIGRLSQWDDFIASSLSSCGGD